ncbi:MAG: DUF5106 domain-containing protein [Bacteroidia bacterium]|nr:DUF5106 domain-containing protein [Bacteroidia bacterium]
MIKHLLAIITILLLLYSNSHIWGQGYEIKVKINGLSNVDLMLGHHYNDKLYPDDTIKLDKKGNGVFKGKKPLPGGMYFIFLPTKTYFDVLIGDNQNFSIENDTSDFLKNIKIKNSPENIAFVEYQKFMLDKQKTATEISNKIKELKEDKEKKELQKQIDALSKEVKEYTWKVIKENEGTLFSKFIKATQEIEVPDPPKDANGKITDSLFQYKYYRSHFFDNFDISDVRLLRTPIYEDKIKKYIEKVIPQIPDTINRECDMLIEKTRSDKDLFRFMLITLFNHYASSQIMGFDAIYVHLGEKYYIPEATWSDTTFLNKLKDRVKKLKPALLGKQAPNLRMLWVPTEHFQQAKTDTAAQNNPHAGAFIDLYNVKAKYTILVFWESDCGHCKKQIPQLYEIYQKLKPKGVEVFAIHGLGGVEGKKKWIKFVNEHEMYDWLNVWNPYDYKYKELLDISSTPVLIVLDKDKKIIAKRLDPKQIEEFIEKLIERDSKKK